MTTPSAKADGFCDHARTIVPRFGRNAQSERSGKDITGGVDITVNDQPTVRTEVNTDSEGFGNIRQASASGANLRSVVGVNLDKLPTSVLYFVGEFGKEHPPARIVDRTSEHTPGQSFDIQILDSDKAIAIDELPAEFMLEIVALVSDMCMSLLERSDSLPTTGPALLTAGNFTLDPAKVSHSQSEVTRILDKLTIGQGSERGKPHIDANNFRRRGSISNIDRHAETAIPLTGLTLKSQSLNLASNRPVHLQFDSADTLDFKPTCIGKVATVPPNREGVAVKPVSWFETGVACFLTGFNPAKESLEGLIDTPQHILASGEVSEFKVSDIPNIFQLASLVVVVTGHTLHAPGVSTLLKCGIVKRAGLPKLVLESAYLLFGRVEAILKSSSCFHFVLSQLYRLWQGLLVVLLARSHELLVHPSKVGRGHVYVSSLLSRFATVPSLSLTAYHILTLTVASCQALSLKGGLAHSSAA